MNENYIPVLVCSGPKTKDGFCYKGQAVKFAASPQTAPRDEFAYYKPDDSIPGQNKTWRNLVVNGQNDPELDLVPAYLLYSPDIYRDFYKKFGSRFYILSAGWGVIRADFKIPAYDITYSTGPNVPKHAKRNDNYGWKDINHLKEDSVKFDSDSEVILFASSTYVSPFCDMAQSIPYKKKILYRSQKITQRQGFVYEYYQTNRRTNWYYEAAGKFLNENKQLPSFGLNKSESRKELKSKYHELCAAYHPDHLNGKDKASGQRVFCEIQDAWDNENYIELENIYEKYQKAKSGELRREPREEEQSEQFYDQQNLYNDYVIDQEIRHNSNPRQSESKNIFMALLVSIIAGVIFVNIMQGCPTRKEPNRTPPPRVEYVLPKSEGSSITVKSDILTKHFGISYEQRQSSNLFMKDSHEYRYNGNGTWTITKKGAVNNTDKNYIDTNNKNEVENYLHGLGF
jgi:hypothetical protein